MSVPDPELLRRIQSLSLKIENFEKNADDLAQQDAARYGAAALKALDRAVSQKSAIFGIEPWHVVHDDAALSGLGEMLLRLRDEKGAALPPYPAVMAFYNNGMAAELDTVLVLCALQQFLAGDEAQVSVNVSGRSLRDAEFIKAVLPRIEAMNLPQNRQIIFEIHESGPSEIMSKRVLDLCRRLKIGFAIDDVGLSMNDIFRLSEFEEIADFVKLDRKSVMAHPENKNSLDHVMTLIAATLPNALIVAEGVKSAEHAGQILSHHPNIHYVQGLYLPPRDVFAREWAEVKAKIAA